MTKLEKQYNFYTVSQNQLRHEAVQERQRGDLKYNYDKNATNGKLKQNVSE